TCLDLRPANKHFLSGPLRTPAEDPRQLRNRARTIARFSSRKNCALRLPRREGVQGGLAARVGAEPLWCRVCCRPRGARRRERMADATLALPQKVKTALDETRILVLGAQVLLGFQFRGTFQEGFEQLPETERVLNAVALILMCGALALLVAPSLYHRVIAAGEDSGWLHGLISSTAQCALAPFALSLGIDVHIGLARITGFQSGIAAGVMFAALALFWWYGFAWIRRVSVGAKERRVAAARREEIERTPLHSKIEQLLTEARVILPGAQALLGFQLAIIVTQAFEKLPPYVKA